MIHFKKLLQSPIYVVATFVSIFLLAGIAFYLWNSPKKFSQQPQKLTSEILREKLRKAFIKNKKQRDPAAKINVQALRQSLQKTFNSDNPTIDFLKEFYPHLLPKSKRISDSSFIKHLMSLFELAKKEPEQMESKFYDYMSAYFNPRLQPMEVRVGEKITYQLDDKELEAIIVFFTDFQIRREGLLGYVAGMSRLAFDSQRETRRGVEKEIKTMLQMILRFSPEKMGFADLAATILISSFAGSKSFRALNISDESGGEFIYFWIKKFKIFFEVSMIEIVKSKYFVLKDVRGLDDFFYFFEKSVVSEEVEFFSIYLWRNLRKTALPSGGYNQTLRNLEDKLSDMIQKHHRLAETYDITETDAGLNTLVFKLLLFAAEESEEMAKAVYQLFRRNIPGFE